MKKYLISFLFAVVISFVLGKTILDNYHEATPVSQTEEIIYVLQQGVYSSLDSIKENTKNISHYIYVKDDKYYRVYVGMSKNKENATKLEVMYKKMGNNIYVREISVKNNEFLEKLDKYDELVSNATEYITMISVMQEVLSDYEKLVVRGENQV